MIYAYSFPRFLLKLNSFRFLKEKYVHKTSQRLFFLT